MTRDKPDDVNPDQILASGPGVPSPELTELGELPAELAELPVGLVVGSSAPTSTELTELSAIMVRLAEFASTGMLEQLVDLIEQMPEQLVEGITDAVQSKEFGALITNLQAVAYETGLVEAGVQPGRPWHQHCVEAHGVQRFEHESDLNFFHGAEYPHCTWHPGQPQPENDK